VFLFFLLDIAGGTVWLLNGGGNTMYHLVVAGFFSPLVVLGAMALWITTSLATKEARRR
jgi:hypothetical protein